MNDLSRWMDEHRGVVAALWASLGSRGPVSRDLDAVRLALSHDRYLLPLERVLAGALRGSPPHLAVYLDERVRHLDQYVDRSALGRRVAEHLSAEAAAVAELVPHLDARSINEAYLELHRVLTDPLPDAAKVLCIGDCVFVETRAFLRPLAAEAGRPVDVKQIFFSARQPAEDVNVSIIREVQRQAPDLVGLSLFTYEGVPPYSAAWHLAEHPWTGRRAMRLVDGLLTLMADTVADIRGVSACPIALHAPAGLPLDRYRRRIPFVPPHSAAQRELVHALAAGVRDLVTNTDNTLLIDEGDAVVRGGGLRAAGRSIFPVSDVPEGAFHPSRLGSVLAHEYDSILDDLHLLGGAKVLLVDFDNTLWRGVMGDGAVLHDTAGQALLRELRRAGVLLVALSKNDARSVRWDEMVLDREDFVLEFINWLPKPDNVANAVRQLDLAPSSFILLDDNPVERALVTERVHGVRALDPSDARAWQAMRRWLDFPSTKQTEEARRRTELYREAAVRRQAMDTRHDFAEMMSSLGLEYSVRRATATDLDRLSELVQRTNQFNTTTRRRSMSDVQALMASGDHAVYVASLKDRFGDLGVVAVAIYEVRDCTFDSVIMSCRAMGFGLEIALVLEVLKQHPALPAKGLFVATERNGPAADLFSRCGFSEQTPGVFAVMDASALADVPPWLKRRTSEQAAAPRRTARV